MARFHYAATSDADMRYFAGKRVADPCFYIETERKRHIFLNNLEIGAFREQGRKEVEALPLEPLLAEARSLKGDEPTPHKLALLLIYRYGLKWDPVTVSKHFPLDIADYLRAQGVTLVVADSFAPERAIKTSIEIEHIRESVKRTRLAFKRIEEMLTVSEITDDAILYRGEPLTSEIMKKEIDRVFVEVGMENSDGLIISSGPQAAMPHHEGAGLIHPHTSIVCDIFPRSKETGYFADVTRTYVKGEASPTLRKMYEAVKFAQDAAFSEIAPGVRAVLPYEAASKIIKGSGFQVGDKGFTHGLGHGLGLEVHEHPRLGAHSTDVLEEGNMITVEPGLYYPEHGGVRLEDVVVVTKTGYENLTDHPRELIIP